MTATVTARTQRPIQVLAEELRHDLGAVLQLLLSISRKETFNRIINCPTYPAKLATEDLETRIQSLLESTNDGSSSMSNALSVIFENAIAEIPRRRLGLYFTPSKVAQYAVGHLTPKPGETILDAGCGTGIFAYELLKALGNRAGRVSYYGVEIDPILALSTAITLDRCNAPPTWHVLYKNFLLIDRSQLTSLGIDTIDAIVANPPFVRMHKIPEREKIVSLLEKRSGYDLSGLSGLHLLFLAQAAYLLRPKGRAVFLFPSEIVGVRYWSHLERQLTREFSLDISEIPGSKASTIRWLFEVSPRSVPYEQMQVDKRHETSKKTEVSFKSISYVHRGISTGANDFFVITAKTIAEKAIPSRFLTKIIPTKIALKENDSTFGPDDWEIQSRSGKACSLLSIPASISFDALPQNLRTYLREGIRRQIPLLPTCQNRDPWYAVRFSTEIPPIIFTYMSRRPRFVYNKAGGHILTNLLGISLKGSNDTSPAKMIEFTKQLNHDFRDWITSASVGRMYAGGLRKFEPGDLKEMPLSTKLKRLYLSMGNSLDRATDTISSLGESGEVFNA